MEGDTSAFSLSGHVPYRPTDTAVASESVAWIRSDLPRMCFEQVSEYSTYTVEGLHALTKFLILGFLQSLYFSPVQFLWPSIAMLSIYERQSRTRSWIFKSRQKVTYGCVRGGVRLRTCIYRIAFFFRGRIFSRISRLVSVREKILVKILDLVELELE